MTPSEIQETLRLSCALLRQFANPHVAESLEKAFAQLTNGNGERLEKTRVIHGLAYSALKLLKNEEYERCGLLLDSMESQLKEISHA